MSPWTGSRSRYSAFAVGDAGYLLRTWHPSGRPQTLSLDPALRWIRLAVLETRDGGLFDATGTVQFRAVYVQATESSTGVMHDVRALGGLVRNLPETCLVVDAITGLGTTDLSPDDWGLDIAYAHEMTPLGTAGPLARREPALPVSGADVSGADAVSADRPAPCSLAVTPAVA